MNVPRKYLKSSVLAAAAVVGILTVPRLAAAEETLTFVWHAGTCADAIVEIAKDYPDKNVKIVPALVPYGRLPNSHTFISRSGATRSASVHWKCRSARQRAHPTRGSGK